MKPNNQPPSKLPAWVRDPRLERPLLIAIVCLSLFLAGLILYPAVNNYVNHMSARALPAVTAAAEATEEPFRLRLEPRATAEPFVFAETGYGWQTDGESVYYVNQNGERLTGLQRVDGRLHYFAPDGTRARALGVDVSYYNEDVNWAQVRAQGIDFAIVRVGGRGWTWGIIYDDARTLQYLHNAREAGLEVGVYFYSTAGTEREAAAEARAALQILDGQRLDLPVFIDVEPSGEYPLGRADLLTREERTKIVLAFCRVIEAAGYEAGVYSGQYYYNTNLYRESFGDRMIWLANYSDAERNRVPGFGGRYAIWQFTDRGQVKGITGYTDMNVIF